VAEKKLEIKLPPSPRSFVGGEEETKSPNVSPTEKDREKHKKIGSTGTLPSLEECEKISTETSPREKKKKRSSGGERKIRRRN